MDQNTKVEATNETKFSFYTLLPGEECLLELPIASFDDQDETMAAISGIIDKISGVANIIGALNEKLLSLIPGHKAKSASFEKHSVFVITNMRCFVASFESAKAKAVGFCSCASSSAVATENVEYTSFPRSVLTEYNSYTCKKDKIVKKSCCFCQKETFETYKIVLTVGLNTSGKNSQIAPERNLVMTLDHDFITSYDQLNGIIAMITKLAQQAN